MPYELHKHGAEWVVTKPDGKILGRHRSRLRAVRQQRALYAHERKEAVTTKAPNYRARAGQTITGNLGRGAGGQFVRAGTGDAGLATEQAQARGRAQAQADAQAKKPKRGRKPAKTDEQRAQEREQRQQERAQERQREQQLNLTTAADQTGLGDHLAALDGFANGEELKPENTAELEKNGLVEKAEDGSYRVTPKGRQLVNAAKRGDAGQVRDALSKAREQANKPEKPKKAPKAPKKKPDKSLQATTNRMQTAPKAGLKPAEANILAALADGETVSDAGRLIELGVAEQTENGIEITSAGRRLVSALERGDARKAQEALQTARKRQTTARTRATRTAAVARRRALRDRQRQERQSLRRSQEDEQESQKALSIYKGRDGRYRWLLISSTAYKDRDGEIVSTKALEQDVARADADGNYGPLLWWHDPSIVIGQCDFNAMSGPVLFESGTFTNERMGELFALKQHLVESSLGFRHNHRDIDEHKIYWSIHRFERSLLPRGRASNLFTSLLVNKERTMDQNKIKQLSELLEIPEAEARQIIAAQVTDIQHKAVGVAYKSVDATEQDTTKATPVAAEEAVAEDVAEEAMEDEEVIEEETTDDESLFTPEELQELAQALAPVLAQSVVEALAPMMGELKIADKMSAAMEEMKSIVGGYTKKKDDEDALLTGQVAELATQLKATNTKVDELNGLVPPAIGRGYRPSQSADTVVSSALKEIRRDPLDEVVDKLFKIG